jgi:NADH:ubiquinone oxidoreductase subunit 2 (subunit N)
MTRISVNEASWDTKYIYTLYFACTTMFTVGYGDILPTNKTEMITIMFIEALGKLLFLFRNGFIRLYCK